MDGLVYGPESPKDAVHEVWLMPRVLVIIGVSELAKVSKEAGLPKAYGRGALMPCISHKMRYIAGLAGVVLLLASLSLLRAGEGAEYTNLNVLVKSAENDKPIFQARLTLQFRMPGKMRSKFTSYTAKTNTQGRYTFTNIPKGNIRLFVTADNHQSYGKELELEQDNQLVEVKLRKPQPVL